MTNKKCFIREYKDDVENNDLPKFGCIILSSRIIENPSADTQVLNFKAPEDLLIKIIGDGHLATSYEGLVGSDEKEYTIPANNAMALYFSNGDYKIEVHGRYFLYRIVNTNTNGANPISVDIDELRYCNLDQIQIRGNLTSGNLDSFNNMTTLLIVSLSRTDVEGKIDNLSKSIGLIYVEFQQCPGVSGRYEDLLVGLLSNGKTSNLEIVAYPNVTLNNIPYAGRLNVSFGTGTITVKNSGITVASYANGTWTYS